MFFRESSIDCESGCLGSKPSLLAKLRVATNPQLEQFRSTQQWPSFPVVPAFERIWRSARCAACSPRRPLIDDLSGVRSAGIDFPVQERAFRPAKDILPPGIEDLQILRENRSLRIANAEVPGDYSKEYRVKLSRSARTSSPRSSRSAYVTNSSGNLLRQVISKSVLSSGLAVPAAWAAPSSIASKFKGRPKSHCAESVPART